MPLPPMLAITDIHERLQSIFPDGTANRNYVTREIAAKTVFVMLYIGAIEGAECWCWLSDRVGVRSWCGESGQAMAGCATQIGSVDHAAAGANTLHALACLTEPSHGGRSGTLAALETSA